MNEKTSASEEALAILNDENFKNDLDATIGEKNRDRVLHFCSVPSLQNKFISKDTILTFWKFIKKHRRTWNYLNKLYDAEDQVSVFFCDYPGIELIWYNKKGFKVYLSFKDRNVEYSVLYENEETPVHRW